MRYLCPECETEMVQTPQGFWMHVESTDCAPEPWPDLLDLLPLAQGGEEKN